MNTRNTHFSNDSIHLVNSTESDILEHGDSALQEERHERQRNEKSYQNTISHSQMVRVKVTVTTTCIFMMHTAEPSHAQ